jgi:hypothetical protein
MASRRSSSPATAKFLRRRPSRRPSGWEGKKRFWEYNCILVHLVTRFLISCTMRNLGHD